MLASHKVVLLATTLRTRISIKVESWDPKYFTNYGYTYRNTLQRLYSEDSLGQFGSQELLATHSTNGAKWRNVQ